MGPRSAVCAPGSADHGRAGRSRVLVVHGEPGIGKTALLEYAASTTPDFQVARAEGVESEMELPFAAASAVRADAGSPGAAAGPAARRPGGGVRAAAWQRAESFLGRPGGGGHAVRRGRRPVVAGASR